MTVHRGMSSAEFIEYLRSWAIEGNAKAVVIDLIDDLVANNNAADELEAAREERNEMHDKADNLTVALRATVEALKAMHTMAMYAPLNEGHDMTQEHIDSAARTHAEALECLEDNAVDERP